MRALLVLAIAIVFGLAAADDGFYPPESLTIVKIGGKDYELTVAPEQQIEVPSIAPGQVLEIGINPRVFTGGKFGEGGTYDSIEAYGLPEGWVSEQSTGFSPMYVKVRISQFAMNGDYSFRLKLHDEDELDRLGNFDIIVKVKIDKDILELVSRKEYTGYAGENIPMDFSITNKGNYPETFTLEISGTKLPRISNNDILLQPGETRNMRIVQKFGEAVPYSGKAVAYSQSSSLIEKSTEFTIINKRTLVSDVYSVRNGVLVFPANVFYSFVSLFSGFAELLLPASQG